MNTYTDLKDIFIEAEDTFFTQSTLSHSELTKTLEPFKQVSKKNREDNEYFWIMVYVTFYSSFKATTVKEKINLKSKRSERLLRRVVIEIAIR